jgi:Flp pilus assembly protein TadG
MVASRTPGTVKIELTQRAALSGTAETIQQSVLDRFLRQIPSRSEVCSMPPSAVPKINILRRFRRNRRGSAAVEFALVAPMFFAVLFAIIELALVFFASQILETVTQDTARLVMTGQVQSGSINQQQFKDAVCAKLVVMFDCVNGVYVDVRSYGGFSTVNLSAPIDTASKTFINDMKYCPGKEGDVVVVRLFYQWPVFVTGLGFNLMNLAGNKRLLTATAAFQNEPFAIPGTTCS